jgi:predicted esterase
VTELPNYKNSWNLSQSSVLSIHGKEDMIVPYQNSLFLEQVLGAKKFSLIPIEEGNHSLIWSNFDIIRTALLNSIRE